MIDSENIGIEHLDSLIDKYIKQSMMNLKTNIIDCCLLHDSKNMVSHNGYIIQKIKYIEIRGVIKRLVYPFIHLMKLSGFWNLIVLI